MSIERERERFYGKRSGKDKEFKELVEENKRLWEENRRLTTIIKILAERQHPPHHSKPIFNVYFEIKNQSNIMANVVLVIGSPKSGIFTLIDNKTLLPIVNPVFSNPAVGANSNPEFATFALDPANPNSLIGTPVAAGTGTVVITTDASYTDAGDGSAQSGSFSVTKTFVVQASADGVTFDVVFP